MNPEEDNVGDVRIKYYTHSEFLQNDYIPVSIIGRQKDRTIVSNDKDSTFLISLGEKKNLKQMINDENYPVRSDRNRIRTLVSLCLLLFYYTILSFELFDMRLDFPILGKSYDSGLFLPSLVLTLATLGLTSLLAKPFSLLL